MSEKKIITRKEAKELGLKRYFTGNPCKLGHIEERKTSNGTCVSCDRERKRRYNAENREKIKCYMMEYSVKNRSSIAKKRRIYYEENFHIIAERNRKYNAENREKCRNNRRNRKARQRNAEGHHTADDILLILDQQNNKCAEPTCAVDLADGYHVDHIMPLILGGSNWPENIQCLCPTCNLKKNKKHPIDWAQENGRLF